MAVRTPSYWQEDWYQPLIEAETVYGHTVQIPKRFEKQWQMYDKELMLMYWQQGRRDGFLQDTSTLRKKRAVDLMKTFLEVYEE